MSKYNTSPIWMTGVKTESKSDNSERSGWIPKERETMVYRRQRRLLLSLHVTISELINVVCDYLGNDSNIVEMVTEYIDPTDEWFHNDPDVLQAITERRISNETKTESKSEMKIDMSTETEETETEFTIAFELLCRDGRVILATQCLHVLKNFNVTLFTSLFVQDKLLTASPRRPAAPIELLAPILDMLVRDGSFLLNISVATNAPFAANKTRTLLLEIASSIDCGHKQTQILVMMRLLLQSIESVFGGGQEQHYTSLYQCYSQAMEYAVRHDTGVFETLLDSWERLVQCDPRLVSDSKSESNIIGSKTESKIDSWIVSKTKSNIIADVLTQYDQLGTIDTFDPNVPALLKLSLFQDWVVSRGAIEAHIYQCNQRLRSSYDSIRYMGIELHPMWIGSHRSKHGGCCATSDTRLSILKQKWNMEPPLDFKVSARQLQMLASIVATVATREQSQSRNDFIVDALFSVGHRHPDETATWINRLSKQINNSDVQCLLGWIKTSVLKRPIKDVQWTDKTLNLFACTDHVHQYNPVIPMIDTHTPHCLENVYWLFDHRLDITNIGIREVAARRLISIIGNINYGQYSISKSSTTESNTTESTLEFVLWAYDKCIENFIKLGSDIINLSSDLLSSISNFIDRRKYKDWRQSDANFIRALLDRQTTGEQLYELWEALNQILSTSKFGNTSHTAKEGHVWTPDVEWANQLFKCVHSRIKDPIYHRKMIDTVFQNAFNHSLLSQQMHRKYGIEYEGYVMRTTAEKKADDKKWQSRTPDTSIIEKIDFSVCSTTMIEFILTFHDPETSDSIWTSYLALITTLLSRQVSPSIVAWFVAHAHIPLRLAAKHNLHILFSSSSSITERKPAAHMIQVVDTILKCKPCTRLKQACLYAMSCIPSNLVSSDLIEKMKTSV